MAARMAMIATTMSSSMRVNPTRWFFVFLNMIFSPPPTKGTCVAFRPASRVGETPGGARTYSKGSPRM